MKSLIISTILLVFVTQTFGTLDELTYNLSLRRATKHHETKLIKIEQDNLITDVEDLVQNKTKAGRCLLDLILRVDAQYLRSNLRLELILAPIRSLEEAQKAAAQLRETLIKEMEKLRADAEKCIERRAPSSANTTERPTTTGSAVNTSANTESNTSTLSPATSSAKPENEVSTANTDENLNEINDNAAQETGGRPNAEEDMPISNPVSAPQDDSVSSSENGKDLDQAPEENIILS